MFHFEFVSKSIATNNSCIRIPYQILMQGHTFQLPVCSKFSSTIKIFTWSCLSLLLFFKKYFSLSKITLSPSPPPPLYPTPSLANILQSITYKGRIQIGIRTRVPGNIALEKTACWPKCTVDYWSVSNSFKWNTQSLIKYHNIWTILELEAIILLNIIITKYQLMHWY